MEECTPGPEEQNENGLHLLDFCALNRLAMTNTFFQHWLCHQMTWFHPAEASRSGRGHVLDYIIVNQHFHSIVLDTRVYYNTDLDSNHRLLVSNKARRRMAQQHPQHQVDSRYLEDQQVSDFRALLGEKLAAGLKSSVEEAWCTLRESLMSAQSCLPTIPDIMEEDWVTDAVREASRKKRDM